MIKDNQTFLNRLHVVLDGLLVVLSYALAWFIKFRTPYATTTPGVTAYTMQTYFSVLYFIVPLYLILYLINNLYTSRRVTRIRNEFAEILRANTMGVVGIMAIFFMLGLDDFSRTFVAIFYVLNLVLTCGFHYFLRSLLYHIRRNKRNLRHVLCIGYSRAAEEYIDRLLNNGQWGYVVHGILDDHVERGTQYRGIKVLGSIANLQYILPENKLDEIAITLPLSDYELLEKLVEECEKSGVHTKFIPDYSSLFPSHPYTEDLMGLPAINIRYVPLTNSWNQGVKRVMDIVGAIVAIVLFSPLMLFAAVGTKLTSPGPIIFKQTRIGLHSKPFTMYKFRTMRVDSEEKGAGWTTKGDSRVTRFGALLRRTSIDEMPQFFNVLTGRMSLVGPRPEQPEFVERFKEEIPRYMIKHQVRPGITGWAQVNGYRGDTSIRRRIDLDLYYIENWSLGLDIRILFMTLFRGFINKNAY